MKKNKVIRLRLYAHQQIIRERTGLSNGQVTGALDVVGQWILSIPGVIKQETT